ncbi:putative dehydrogenase [uncultured Desulfobacterium sp.]|uniref:Putative dehydrogenase n=1 Tax=uncultured Desulfobacterium sp. TaxID=201089 RepID=A0A445MXP3_9BACT|nr:putative dehydrogenase [uncultured Desulfobacterium sp.]
MDKNFSIIGKSLPRSDAFDKVTGVLHQFVSDIKLPGMLHMKILRSPVTHARIKSIDVSRAENLPGVFATVTYKDMIEYDYPKGPPHLGILKLDERVRFIGDEVVAVAAETEEIAEEALDLLKVEYEPLPVIHNREEALAKKAFEIHSGSGNVQGGNPYEEKEGDIAAGFDASDVTVEVNTKLPNASKSVAEPRGYIVAWNLANNSLEVWDTEKSLYRTRNELADFLRIPRHNIRAHCIFSGGDYGSKGQAKYKALTALASKKSGRPVKYLGSRFESCQDEGPKYKTEWWGKMGFKKDGTITAKEIVAFSNIGAYGNATPPEMAPVVIQSYVGPFRFNHTGYYTNKPNTAGMRGWGTIDAVICVEILLDLAAEKLGIDPIEIRLKNYVKPPQKTHLDHYMIGVDGATVLTRHLKQAKESIGWSEKWKGFGKPYSLNGTKRKGIGFSARIHNVDAWMSACNMMWNIDGKLIVYAGVANQGQGSDTVSKMIAAEVAGARYEDTFVALGDTAMNPTTASASGQGLTESNGTAVKLAAEDLKRNTIKTASSYLKLNPVNLDIKNSFVYVKGTEPEQGTPISIITAKLGEIYGYGVFVPPFGQTTHGYAFVDVEVDTETGKVEILNIVAADNCGHAINPRNAMQGAEGARMFNLTMALLEDSVFDPNDLRRLNFAQINSDGELLSVDSPPQTSILVEEPTPFSYVWGAVGITEGAGTATCVALANAFYNATGVRIYEFPLTPARVLQVLHKV